MPQVIITGDLIKDVKDGKPQLLKASDNTVLLVSDKQEVLAVYEKRESGLYFSVRGLF